MPVSPPYSIIDTIARLREQGDAAWGTAARDVGQSLGTGMAKGMAGGAAMRVNAAKDAATRYHEATLFADKNFDWEHAPQASKAPGGAPSGILQPANAAVAPGGAPPPPPTAKRPEGSVTMNDLYLAHGLKPVAGGDQLIGKPKAQQKSEAAQIIEAMKTGSAEKIAADKEAAATKRAQIGAAQRKSTGETAAGAKVEAAKISAAAKRDIAEINFRLKSPDHQIQLQAMKDRDAYIIKHPTSATLFGTPAEIGKIPAGKEKPTGNLDDLDALMMKHGGQ